MSDGCTSLCGCIICFTQGCSWLICPNQAVFQGMSFGGMDLLSLAYVAGSSGVLGLWTGVGRGALCQNRTAKWGRRGTSGTLSLCTHEIQAGLLAQWKVTRANVKWLERWSSGPGVLIAKRGIQSM